MHKAYIGQGTTLIDIPRIALALGGNETFRTTLRVFDCRWKRYHAMEVITGEDGKGVGVVILATIVLHMRVE